MSDYFQILLKSLAEADTGIENDAVTSYTGFKCDPYGFSQFPCNIRDQIPVECVIAVMHKNAKCAVLRSYLCHLGILSETPDIVDDIRTRIESFLCNGCLVSIYGNGNVEILSDLLNNGNNSLRLFIGVNGSITRSCGFTADINDINAFGNHLLGSSESTA